jgi:hypothetical protein
MGALIGLYDLLANSAERFPEKVAVEEADGDAIRYRDLAELAGQLRNWLLAARGVPRRPRRYLPT